MRTLLALILCLALIGCGDSKTETIPLKDVPEPAMKAAKEKLSDVTFEQAWKTKGGNYEIRGKTKTGKVRDVQVTPEGKIVEVD